MSNTLLIINIMTIFILKIQSCPFNSKSKLSMFRKFLTEEEKELLEYPFSDEASEFEVAFLHRLPSTYLSERNVDSGSEHEFSYNMTAFGNKYPLQLSRNTELVSNSLRIVRKGRTNAGTDSKGKERQRNVNGQNDDNEEIEITSPTNNCHFLSTTGGLTAAISNCPHQEGMSGVIMTGSDTIHIDVLPQRLQNFLSRFHGNHINDRIPHILRRIPSGKDLEKRDTVAALNEFPLNDIVFSKDTAHLLNHPKAKPKQSKTKSKSKRRTIELALFLDEAAYEKFAPYVNGSDDHLRDLLLAYVNQIQAIYYQPSLGEKIDISLVYLELQQKQPSDLPHFDGDRDQLLTSFCKYQKRNNPGNDTNSKHWDLAVYLSGLDLFVIERGHRNIITMGLAPIGGVCYPETNCLITEFGSVNKKGKPYPTSGWTSAYVTAHEMGHNLGMWHDGMGNDCEKNGFIMSASRGTRGETTWSTCSADIIRDLDAPCLLDRPTKSNKGHRQYKELPGQVFDGHDQCRLLLRDPDARLYYELTEDVCEQIFCKTPNRMGYYLAGPALEGTFCDGGKWCQSGECVPWQDANPPIVKGGWSKWEQTNCTSGCIEGSKGIIKRKRYCNNPKPQNTEQYCEGPDTMAELCDAKELCNSYETTHEFAIRRCTEFAKLVTDLTGKGTQVPLVDDKAWQPCTIYCKLKTGAWFTPRHDLNDLNVDTRFPDGTWCNRIDRENYYCKQGLCVSERSSLEKSDSDGTLVWNMLENARPGDIQTTLSPYELENFYIDGVSEIPRIYHKRKL